jgi:CheY-like chemotaxis protein
MKTILVVEDFVHARHFICRKLQNRGYNTLGASTVKEAYDVLSHEPNEISMVLSDVDVADHNGLDLLKTIKNNPALKNIPVAFWAIDSNPSHAFFKEIDRAINIKGAMINLVA